MTAITKQIVDMIDMLPEKEQQLACEVIKRLVIAWDPDFKKLTTEEALQLEQAKKQIDTGETIGHDDIDWK